MSWRTVQPCLGLLALALPAVFADHPRETPCLDRARYLMGSLCTITVCGDGPGLSEAAEQALDRIAQVEQALTTWRPDGELARVNRAILEEGVPLERLVSRDLADALSISQSWSRRTGGVFDPAIGSLSAAWGLQTGGALPAGTVLASARAAAGPGGYVVDTVTRRLRVSRRGLQFDLGGIGKGFALDEAAKVLSPAGVTAALFNFGGQILATGPAPGGGPWPIAIADPADRGRPLSSFPLEGGSLATSGNGEHQFLVDGQRYGHLIDPRTGTASQAQGSVSVWAENATDADAASTALALAGPAAGRRFLPPGARALWLVPGSAADPSGDGSSQEGAPPANGPPGEKIEQLERKIDLLAEELESLRHGTEEKDAGPLAKLHTGLAPSASKIYRTAESFALGGYGEWLYQGFSSTTDSGAPSGKSDVSDFLRFILYTGYKFNDSILLNAELEWEHATTDAGGEASVEFAYLDFLLHRAVNIRAGMVLVPVGLINELHEPPTFLSARRPDVETTILPSTWRETGAGLWGDLGEWDYRVYVVTSLDSSGFSSSKGIRGGRQKGSKAKAEDWALTGRLDYRGVPGLLVGASFFRGDTGQDAMVTGKTLGGKVTTLDIHAQHQWRALNLRGVWARVDVDDADLISEQVGETVGSRMKGWYLQAGYDLLAASRWGELQLVPFVKYESFDTLDRVPAGFARGERPAYDRSSWTYGVTFKPHPSVAIKLDFQDYDNSAGTAVDQVNVALGFSF